MRILTIYLKRLIVSYKNENNFTMPHKRGFLEVFIMIEFKQSQILFRLPATLKLKDLNIHNIKTLSTNEILNFLAGELDQKIREALKIELIQNLNTFNNLIIKKEQE